MESLVRIYIDRIRRVGPRTRAEMVLSLMNQPAAIGRAIELMRRRGEIESRGTAAQRDSRQIPKI